MSHWQADVVVAVALLPVVLLPLAVGGVHPEVQVGFAVIELVCALAWVGLSIVKKRPLYTPWTALPFALGAVVTALEILPLPKSVLALVAPHTAETRAFVVGALPVELQGKVLSVVSMDPPETKAALVRLIGALALTFVVANGARRRERARLIWRMLLGGAVLLMVVRAAYGLGVVHYQTGDLVGPVVNANHLSKVLGALSLLAVARATLCKDPVERGLSAVIGATAAISVVLTLSRGGIGAWCAGVVVAVLVLHRKSSVARRLAVVTVLVVGVAAAGISLAPRVVGEMGSITTEFDAPGRSKIALWEPALKLAIQLTPAGTGNGAFAFGFSGQSMANTINAAELTFSNVENIAIAPLVEHGLFAGAVMLIVAVVVGARLVRQRGDARAVVPAIAVLVVGDLFDFALEIPAGLALMSVALGLGAADTLVERAPRTAAAFALLVLAGAGLVGLAATGAILDWRYRGDAALVATHNPVQRRVLLEESLAAHPFDAVRCAELATDARYRRQPQQALAWANRAINLWPMLPAAHLEAARALVVLGHLEQAMLEYREAATAASDPRTVLREAFARTPDVSFRRRALPNTAASLASLCALLQTEGRLADASTCAFELAQRVDATASQRLEPLRVALALHDVAALRNLVDSAVFHNVTSGDASVLRARAIKELDGAPQALQASASWPASRELTQWRLNEQLQANALDDALTTAHAMEAFATSVSDRDTLDHTIADIHGKRGDHGKRLLVLRGLSRRHPDDVNLLADVGLCQLELGDNASALMTLRRLRALGQVTPRTRALARALGQATDE